MLQFDSICCILLVSDRALGTYGTRAKVLLVYLFLNERVTPLPSMYLREWKAFLLLDKNNIFPILIKTHIIFNLF